MGDVASLGELYPEVVEVPCAGEEGWHALPRGVVPVAVAAGSLREAGVVEARE